MKVKLYRKIPLTQGQFALVDAEDFERVSKYKWTAEWSKDIKSYYAFRSSFINGKQKMIRMHRFILNVPKGMYVDHINHNTLDNRKSNLRVCSNKQNVRNQKLNSKNSTGFKGVHKTHSKKVQAKIHVSGKTIYLGCFSNPKEAAIAYNKAAKKYFGKFALLNKI